MRVIGIDVGTTTVCGLSYNTIDHSFDAITLKNNAALHSSQEWEKTQDPEKLISIVFEILDYFSLKYDLIDGIGITGQMHGILYTDDAGNDISPLYTWEDKRGNQVFYNDQTYAGFISEITGYNVASGFGLVTHFYNLKNGIVPYKAAKICTIMDYLVMKLSGKVLPLIDPTNAAALGLFNLGILKFDQEALLKAGMNPDILPEIVPSAYMAGLFQGKIPVYSAIGDNQASFLGSVSQVRSSILVNIGTGSQISIFKSDYLKSEFLDTRPFPGGGYLLVGAALYGGKSLILLKSFFEQAVKLFSPYTSGEIDFFGIMNSIDRSLLSDESCLQVDPLFNGTRKYPSGKGMISEISDINFTPENLIAGFLKGLCMELNEFFREMPDIQNRELSCLVGSGNAVRMNPILKEMLEITFRRKLFIPVFSEEAAFGACLCALVGGHHLSGFPDAGKLVDYILSS